MTREIALHCMKSYSELHSDLCELCPIYGQTGSDHCFEDALQYVIGILEQEPKKGHWIEVAKYSDGKHEIECSKCGSHIFDRGHANSYIVKEKYKYCPRCGAKMVKPHESEEV